MEQNHLKKILQSIIVLLSKTHGRDRILRVIQYLSLFLSSRYLNRKDITDSSILHTKWKAVFTQSRKTRKILRFLRILQHITKIRQMIKKYRQKRNKSTVQKMLYITTALNSLFALLFFLYDHLVCLAEIGVISKDNLTSNHSTSLKFFILENILGLIKNIMEFVEFKLKLKKQQFEKNEQIASFISLEMIRNIFDTIIGICLINKNVLTPEKIGQLGIVSSLISCYQIWI